MIVTSINYSYTGGATHFCDSTQSNAHQKSMACIHHSIRTPLFHRRHSQRRVRFDQQHWWSLVLEYSQEEGGEETKVKR